MFAYVNNALKPPRQSRASLIYLKEEKIDDNTYSCLVKWAGTQNRPRRITIEAMKFQRHREDFKSRHGHVNAESNQMVWVNYDDKWLPRGDSIEFALSSRQVIREGQVVPIVTVCHQFSDVRHLIQMPNLNPKIPLYAGELPGPGGGYGKRYYFGKLKDGDIWFGEKAFVNDNQETCCEPLYTRQ